MSKILVFAGSSSSISINHALVTSVANQIVDHEVEIIRLTDFELPVYSYDIEKNEGIPLNITRLKNKIDQSEALIISVNEHNGTVSSFFKNVLDWLSRFDPKFLEGKSTVNEYICGKKRCSFCFSVYRGYFTKIWSSSGG